MKNYIPLLILNFLIINALSQEKNIVVEGSIKNTDGESIENVNIYNSNNIGTISDSRGEFLLIASTLDKEIFVSHVSYEGKKITLSEEFIKNDTLSLEIILEAKQHLIESVNISGNKDWQVLKSKKPWVYDYELLGKNVLILLSDSSRYELRYLNWQDSLLFSSNIKERKVNGFIKDGLGNVHIGLNDSVFQMYIHNNKVLLYEGVSYIKYNTILEPIVAETDSLILLQRLKLNNQKLVYFGVRKSTKTTIPISQIYSEERYKYSVEVKQHQMAYAGINYMGDLSFSDISKWRKYFQWGIYFDKIATLPIYSPLIKMDSNFCIFDLVENKIEHYHKSGYLLKSIEASFNQNKKILSIDFDKYTNSTYSLSKINGGIQIDQIDVHTGTIKKTFQIKNYGYPEKIRICDDNVYFLHRDVNSTKKLVRIPLDQLHKF
jgi:hypothetical protein